jgi:hypothetical protein
MNYEYENVPQVHSNCDIKVLLVIFLDEMRKTTKNSVRIEGNLLRFVPVSPEYTATAPPKYSVTIDYEVLDHF